MIERACIDCDQPGQFPSIDEVGDLEGWLCASCERTRRLRRIGWKRRVKRRLRHLFKL